MPAHSSSNSVSEGVVFSAYYMHCTSTMMTYSTKIKQKRSKRCFRYHIILS